MSTRIRKLLGPKRFWSVAVYLLLLSFSVTALSQTTTSDALPGTQLLVDLPSDPAAAMVAGIDRFALRQIEKSRTNRSQFWQESSSKAENIQFLKTRLGMGDSPDVATASETSPTKNSGVLYEQTSLFANDQVRVEAIRWAISGHPAPQLSNAVSLWGEGLLVRRVQDSLTHRAAMASKKLAIVIPDADELPEAICGLTPGLGANRAGPLIVQQLLESGYSVAIPQLANRATIRHGNAEMSHREYLHRAAFELGRSLVGYEVLGVQRLIDEFASTETIVIGFGEGGMVALLSGAIDERINTTVCCGYFGPRESMWREPLCRNLYGVLERFGDAELAAMIAPRKLLISTTPHVVVSRSTPGAAPAQWQSPSRSEVEAEFECMQDFAEKSLGAELGFAHLFDPSDDDSLDMASLFDRLGLSGDTKSLERWQLDPSVDDQALMAERAKTRMERLIDNIDAHTQAVLEECEYARVRFINLGLPRDDRADALNVVDTSTSEAYEKSTARYRQLFVEDVIGKVDAPLLDANPRTRKQMSGAGWTGYDVVLDVFDDVFTYGVLLLPDDLQAGERRPVVVCQHGLEGRPQDTIVGDHDAYHDFAARLASRGFIVFAPQNPYIGQDAFRTLQRKLNPLGTSLFSIIGPQHQQMLNWLSTLPQVDPERIAFYGLSYGGKSAMRLPAMLPQYCLSICSADFNDWVWKNASSRSPYSYVGTGEYEIFEYDLGHTFNYAEMAALIAPRPFMVERGHFDGVAPDDRVAKEFARVRFLYAARLKLADRCEIEWFDGPHTINGKGSFDFLHKHLRWPVPKE